MAPGMFQWVDGCWVRPRVWPVLWAILLGKKMTNHGKMISWVKYTLWQSNTAMGYGMEAMARLVQ